MYLSDLFRMYERTKSIPSKQTTQLKNTRFEQTLHLKRYKNDK